MDDIPQDVLHEAHTAEPGQLLRVVAGHFADRAERTRALRKKSWQSTSRELDGVADHIRAYAEQLEQFALNNPDGVSLVGDDETRWEDPRDTTGGKTDKAKPQLPGNTGRCASFRRATPDDAMICARERGHDGNHIGYAADGADPEPWPRTPSGHVCGDWHSDEAGNCALPLGHNGDHGNGLPVGDVRRLEWPRGVGLRPLYAPEASVDPINGVHPEPPLTTEDELFPGQCEARQDGERCMLPGTHTGVHKGRKGATWARVIEALTPAEVDAQFPAEPAATLGDIAEQQRATMVIPEQRAESDPVPQLAGPEFVAAAQAAIASTPAGVLVAEMKEEVSAAVDGFAGNPFLTAGGNVPENASLIGNPFAPLVQTVGIGPGPALGNPFQAPAPPPAAFLPPHMVPGAPKAHQSHSSITTMEKCGLQYRLKYRDGIGDDTPAWWNVAGTAFHTVVQAIEARYADAEQAGGNGMWHPAAPLMDQEREAAAMWKEAFAALTEHTERSSGKARSTWKAAKGGKEGEAFWREYGGDLARMYVAHRRRFLAEPEGWRLLSKPGGEGWAHEVEFNTEVDGVLLKGFIDAAWISADGATILIEDFKSGSSEGDPFQPKLYGAALRALGFTDGRRVIARFYEARKGAHSATVELTPADDAEVSYRANTAQAMDRAGIFPPSPSGYNCSTCPVKSRCPIMATKGN